MDFYMNTIPASSVIPKKVVANARVDICNGVLYEDNWVAKDKYMSLEKPSKIWFTETNQPGGECL